MSSLSLSFNSSRRPRQPTRTIQRNKRQSTSARSRGHVTIWVEMRSVRRTEPRLAGRPSKRAKIALATSSVERGSSRDESALETLETSVIGASKRRPGCPESDANPERGRSLRTRQARTCTEAASRDGCRHGPSAEARGTSLGCSSSHRVPSTHFVSRAWQNAHRRVSASVSRRCSSTPASPDERGGETPKCGRLAAGPTQPSPPYVRLRRPSNTRRQTARTRDTAAPGLCAIHAGWQPA